MEIVKKNVSNDICQNCQVDNKDTSKMIIEWFELFQCLIWKLRVGLHFAVIVDIKVVSC